ncbi:putative phage protein (TIGR02218 family) [Peteryoungia aggregata LMG 23059]|uniref:Phage protein (TIGR02218 family) n=1 Tax=Peteryoungia aggregata LMG 23059 TaxID=1368425 RepID=A0ABU0GCS2_9HYPH|nr:DUF2163 domain-containing protein [Peteryoungia aggregata]MDQ0423152.1 putative phage protein (TIGR02218 family) [Peteryoungia aggregata LMG 23059]
MKRLSQALAAHVATGETTLCRAWRVTCRDGFRLGFTEHDQVLAFDATVFEPGTGFAATEASSASGLAAPGAEVRGGFSSAAISEADLAAGRYDGARVELFLVNWQAPEEQHALISVQEIGEVNRAGPGFSAELRNFAHRLQQPEGRIYNRRCDADLGDSRCRVDMGLANRRVAGVVAEVLAADRLTISGLPDLSEGHFRLGHLRFDSGVLSGRRLAIEESGAGTGGLVTLRLWLPLEARPAPGDAVTLTVGCDKSFSTCRTKFGNPLNFRGFPHMPGSDFAYSYVSGDSTHDGGVLYR